LSHAEPHVKEWEPVDWLLSAPEGALARLMNMEWQKMRRTNRSSRESKPIACRNSGIATLRTRKEAIERTLQELRRESDRGCVLVGAAALDISLKRLTCVQSNRHRRSRGYEGLGLGGRERA
jgi:hypothetical protein